MTSSIRRSHSGEHGDRPDPVSVSPEGRRKLDEAKRSLGGNRAVPPALLAFRLPELPGLNDGTIYPPGDFPLGTSTRSIRRAAAERAPLRGTIRVVIVLVDFPDKELTESADHFRSLFFSTGELPDGSVKEYYTEVTNGLIEIAGEVVGPYRMPRNMTEYGHGKSSMIDEQPNGQTLALDAATAANADVDFGPYDNDGNGFVDAFIVLHAGPGAEVTLDGGDIWSHKWTLPDEPLDADGTKIFAYLTVPEDCKIGVCAHELGHLLFGWPDLYDTDDSSAGLGDWCLMAGGSWNGDSGDVPAHPSAWCKAEQGWVTVENRTGKETVDVKDVKDDFSGVPALEAGRGQPGVLPGREPPEGGLRQGAARRTGCSSTTSTTHWTATRTRPTTRSAWCRLMAKATSRAQPTRAIPATHIQARATTAS